MVTQPVRMEIPWSKFIWVITNHLLAMRCSISYAYLIVYPYGLFRVYFVLIKVEYLFLMNTTFLMGGMFSTKHTWWIHLYESGGEAASYENLGKFSRALMNNQTGLWPICINSLCTTHSWKPMCIISSLNYTNIGS